MNRPLLLGMAEELLARLYKAEQVGDPYVYLCLKEETAPLLKHLKYMLATEKEFDAACYRIIRLLEEEL